MQNLACEKDKILVTKLNISDHWFTQDSRMQSQMLIRIYNISLIQFLSETSATNDGY